MLAMRRSDKSGQVLGRDRDLVTGEHQEVVHIVALRSCGAQRNAGTHALCPALVQQHSQLRLIALQHLKDRLVVGAKHHKDRFGASLARNAHCSLDQRLAIH